MNYLVILPVYENDKVAASLRSDCRQKSETERGPKRLWKIRILHPHGSFSISKIKAITYSSPQRLKSGAKQFSRKRTKSNMTDNCEENYSHALKKEAFGPD